MQNFNGVSRIFRFILVFSTLLFLEGGLGGCGKAASVPVASPSGETTCAPQNLSVVTGSTGNANVFLIDPISASGNSSLSPSSDQLNGFATPVKLQNLTGEGVLSGKYVNVVNNKECQANYGAYSKKNDFTYSHNNWKFQEAMAYFFGDTYRAGLDKTGYLLPNGPVTIVVHCLDQDNAFFERDIQGDKVFEFICLGDSVSSQGASYADDGIVTVHELQHATTLDTYSPVQDLNQLHFDEAGALNEAISDFMGLIFADSIVSPVFNLDPRIFSRWALGTFDHKASHLRGAHKCPAYDSHFPTCDRFPGFEVPSAANGNSTTISYVYPDGIGWPFPNNYRTNNPALLAYESSKSMEEIHNDDVIMVGALWDVYTALQKNHSGDKAFANRVSSQLVMEAVKHLPQPDATTNRSPVTFISMASAMVQYAGQIPELTSTDSSSLTQALTDRGLYHYEPLRSEDWMEVGAGLGGQIISSVTPGVFIEDDPARLKSWLSAMNKSTDILARVPENLANSRLDPGEVAAIWFDIQNNSELTAGGVLVTVASLDPEVEILDGSVNDGFLPLAGEKQAQVMYAKINGKTIVSQLNPATVASPLAPRIPLGNTYFSTNPYFNRTYRTAVWIKVSPNAAHRKEVRFLVQATPANGVTGMARFPVIIN